MHFFFLLSSCLRLDKKTQDLNSGQTKVNHCIQIWNCGGHRYRYIPNTSAEFLLDWLWLWAVNYFVTAGDQSNTSSSWMLKSVTIKRRPAGNLGCLLDITDLFDFFGHSIEKCVECHSTYCVWTHNNLKEGRRDHYLRHTQTHTCYM